MWLACYTEQEIAEEVGLHPKSKAVRLCGTEAIWQKNHIFSLYEDPKWKPPFYDVWRARTTQAILVLIFLVSPINAGLSLPKTLKVHSTSHS